jgi:hypothetical protein
MSLSIYITFLSELISYYAALKMSKTNIQNVIFIFIQTTVHSPITNQKYIQTTEINFLHFVLRDLMETGRMKYLFDR